MRYMMSYIGRDGNINFAADIDIIADCEDEADYEARELLRKAVWEWEIDEVEVSGHD